MWCGVIHDCRGRLFISIFCRYGEVSVGVGILLMLPGYVYFIIIYKCKKSTSCICIWHFFVAYILLVCILLGINLNCGNIFCMCFVDFVAVNLVSCIVIIAGLFGVFDIS